MRKRTPNGAQKTRICIAFPGLNGELEVILAETYDGMIVLPGGVMEEGEEPNKTIHREVLEETGIVLDDTKLCIEKLLYLGTITAGRKVHLFWQMLNEKPKTVQPRKFDSIKKVFSVSFDKVSENLTSKQQKKIWESICKKIAVLQQ